jgi:hypothetical protein
LHSGSNPLVAFLASIMLAVVVAGCGTHPYESSTHDAQRLVPQLADLPPGFSLDPAESFPVPTSKILAEPPFSASLSAIIRRERLSGYQAAFTSPRGRPIECSAAVYRSSAAARKLYRLRTQSVSAYVADLGGRSVRVTKIGEETSASRFKGGSASYFGIAWRYRNVLSNCVSGQGTPRAEVLVVARAQQERIESVLGARR